MTRQRRQRRKRSQAKAWIRFIVPSGGSPYEYELILRHRGVTVLKRRGDADEPEAAVQVSAAQQQWAEEILFVQLGLTPAMADSDITPSVLKRIGRREQYDVASTWGKPAGAGGVQGVIVDIVAGMFSPYSKRRDPGANRLKRRR